MNSNQELNDDELKRADSKKNFYTSYIMAMHGLLTNVGLSI